MAAIDVVNRVLREFKRYTGDGLANEPVGAPLPVGDPASGVHNPKKSELREALLVPLSDATAEADRAEDEASAAEDAATRAEAAAAGVEYPVSYEPQVLSVERQKQAAENIRVISYAGDQETSDAEQATARLNSGIPVGTNERRDQVGLQEKRVLMSGAGQIYIIDPEDIAPAVHYALLGTGETAYLDVSVLRDYEPYVIINGSINATGVLELDCGEEAYFKANGILTADATQTTLKVRAGERVVLTKVAGNAIHVEGKRPGNWIVGSSYRYRYLPDGKIEAIYTRTASISASAESSANTFPAELDVSNAKVVGVAVNPKADGSAPPNIMPQVTKLGTAHGLAANAFAIRNPNGSLFEHPIVVHFTDIEEA